MLAETRNHANWELIRQCAKQLGAEATPLLKEAYEEVEDKARKEESSNSRR